MSGSRIFFLVLIFFISGIFVRSFFETGLFLIFLLIVFSLSVSFVFYQNKKILVVSLLGLSFGFGLWRSDCFISRVNEVAFSEEAYFSEAVVSVEPIKSEKYQNIVVKIENHKNKNFKALISADRNADISYGDRLRIDCVLEVPKNFNDSFDYRMYLAKNGIFYVCKGAKIEKTGENDGFFLYVKLLRLKDGLEECIYRLIPQPQSALASGILFGGTDGLSRDVKDDFSRTGMTHIVAVSGFNVTIIAECLLVAGIFLGLWRNKALWVAILGIAIFVLAIGFPSSAVRAGIMGAILLWAMKNGRLSDSTNAIVFSGALMLVLNPLLGRWDVGFQLSFLATLGIVLLSPLFENSFMKRHRAFGFFEIIILAVSAQVFVLPIIAYNFEAVSVVSLFANVLVLPVVPFSMFFSFLVAVSGTFLPFFSTVLAWLAYILLKYEVDIVVFFSSLNWASIEIKRVSPWFVAAYYFILSIFIYYLNWRKTKKEIKQGNE